MGVAPKFTNPNTSGPYVNVMGIPNLHMKKNPDDSDTSPPSATGLFGMGSVRIRHFELNADSINGFKRGKL